MKSFNSSLWIVLLIPVATLLAKDFWLERDYTKWEKKDVIKMLSDSPWAQTQAFTESVILSGSAGRVLDSSGTAAQSSASSRDGRSGPTGAGGVMSGDHQSTLLYYIRFYSALPIRQALVRMSMLNGQQPAAEAVDKFLHQPPFPDDMIIGVAPAPGQDRQEFEVLTAALIKNDTWLIKKNRERVQLRDYLAPSKTGGTEAYYLFPRVVNGKPSVDISDSEVRFLTKLGNRELSRAFKLEKMVLGGKLAL